MPLLLPLFAVAVAAAPGHASLEAGRDVVCRLSTDGALWCSDPGLSAAALPRSGVQSVSMGFKDTTCVVDTEGALRCAADVTPSPLTKLHPRPTGTGLEQIEVLGPNATCGRFVGGFGGGKIACWGAVSQALANQQLGAFAGISGFDQTLCAWDAKGSARCMGEYAPTVDQAVRSMSVGSRTCAVLADGALRCWAPEGSPLANPPSGTFEQIDVGANETACALDTAGEAHCWGTMTAKSETGPFATLSVGSTHACGLRPTGEVVCWGDYTRFLQPGTASPTGHVDPAQRKPAVAVTDPAVLAWAPTAPHPAFRAGIGPKADDVIVATPDALHLLIPVDGGFFRHAIAFDRESGVQALLFEDVDRDGQLEVLVLGMQLICNDEQTHDGVDERGQAILRTDTLCNEFPANAAIDWDGYTLVRMSAVEALDGFTEATSAAGVRAITQAWRAR